MPLPSSLLKLPNDKVKLPCLGNVRIQLFRQRLSKKSVKAYSTLPKGSLGNTQWILSFIEIYWLFPRLRFGIVAYALTFFFFFFFFFGGGKTFVETDVNNSYLRNRTQYEIGFSHESFFFIVV